MIRIFLPKFFLLLVLASVICKVPTVLADDITKESIQAYYLALENHNVVKLEKYYANDIIYEDIATGDIIKGRAKTVEFVKAFLKSSPGVKVKATNIIFDTGLASVEWLMSAGSGADAWSVRGATVIEYENSVITRISDYWNN